MNIGRLFVAAGLLLVAVGVVFILAARFTPLGRLPGDILLRRGNFTFYFPWVTCLVVSAILTLAMWFFGGSGPGRR